ncbi:hypothetical protein BJ875DRAFT_355123, partial [Amylocarpus encephaloides]
YGYPVLPQLDTKRHYDLLRQWIHDCDSSHTFCKPISPHRTRLPTRVLYVGTIENPQLRLHCPTEEYAKYIALSRCWGGPDPAKNFSTFGCNIDARCGNIQLEDLPIIFRDAITVTRELGIQFLWIDSICIVQ